MSIEPRGASSNLQVPMGLCLTLSVFMAALRLGPVLWNPSQYSVGGWGHPDNLGNHWLLVWVAERLRMGESILHNTEYYVPVGDYPWLAGNGSEGFLYAPFHWLLDWPTAVVPLVVLYFVGIGLGGYTIALQAGAGRWGALVASTVLTSSGFWTREMNAGRFSQLDGMWLLLSFGLFLGLCIQSRIKLWIVGCGICIGLTGFFYWYYAYFFVVSAAVCVGCALLFRLKLQWKQISQAALVSWITIAPLAFIYWKNWSLVPGVNEVVFPSPDAFADAMTLSGSWLVPFGRTAGAVQSIPTLLLTVAGCAQIRKFDLNQRWGVFSALLLCLVFGLLAFGPKTPLFELFYGWADPLRRFWWPSRHLVIWTVGFSILSGFGAQTLLERVSKRVRGPTSVGLALLIPLSFWLQGAQPFHANHTPIEYPVEEYAPIAALNGDAIIMHPINPKVANTQLPLLLQLTHRKRLLTGHGMWVDRVRPQAWDQFIEGNTFLSSLSKYEVGETTELTVSEKDIRALEVQGLDLIVLDAKLFPRPLMGLVPNLAKVYTTLFGQPTHRGEQLRVWSTANWTGTTQIELPTWILPPNLTLGNGRHKMPDPAEGRGVR